MKYLNILMLVFISPLMAQDDELENLLDMSLSDLLNVTITSNRAENIAHTPAIVSRYEAKDMAHLGLDSLKDMLSFIPGFVVNDSEIGTGAIMIRGLVEGFNQKVLFLLDGVPYWQPSHGDNALLGIAFESIQRVEVIRGPGAVIYGTNATGGVVNVITKSENDRKFSMSTSSQGITRAAINMGGYWGNLGQLNMTASLRRDDGYSGFFNTRGTPPFYPADTPRTGFINRYQEHDSLMLRYKNGDFNGGVHIYGSDSSGLAAAASIVNEAILKYRGTLVYGDYLKEEDKYDLRLFADHNNHYLSIPTEALFAGRHPGVQEMSGNGGDNDRTRFGAQFTWHFNDNVHWLFGYEDETRSTGEYGNTPTVEGFERVVTMERTELRETSLFTQLDFEKGSWRVLVGGRNVDNELAGSRFNPRGSLIYKLSEKRSLKLLYSVGFNSPNFIQQGLVIPFVVAGDPNNKAEIVKTIDLAYTHADDKQLLVVNAYRLEAEDFIRRTPNPNAPGSIFSNADNFSRHGVELDYQRGLKTGRLFANLAWQKEANEVRENDGSALFAPKWKLSAGYFARAAKYHDYGLAVTYRSEREEVSDEIMLQANYGYHFKDFTFFLRGRNLLGEEFVTPDVGNFVPNRLSPGGDPDPDFSLGIDWNF